MTHRQKILMCSALIWPMLLVSCISTEKLVLRQTATCEIQTRIDSLTSALRSEDSVVIEDYFTSAEAKARILTLASPKNQALVDRGAGLDRISIEKIDLSDGGKSARVRVFIVGITCGVCRAILYSYARADIALQQDADGRWWIYESTDIHVSNAGSTHPHIKSLIKPRFKPINPPCKRNRST